MFFCSLLGDTPPPQIQYKISILGLALGMQHGHLWEEIHKLEGYEHGRNRWWRYRFTEFRWYAPPPACPVAFPSLAGFPTLASEAVNLKRQIQGQKPFFFLLNGVPCSSGEEEISEGIQARASKTGGCILWTGTSPNSHIIKNSQNSRQTLQQK